MAVRMSQQAGSGEPPLESLNYIGISTSTSVDSALLSH